MLLGSIVLHFVCITAKLCVCVRICNSDLNNHLFLVPYSKTKEIPLKCKAPVDFEFNISFPQPHPAFVVEPLSGVIPAHGETVLKITFSPTDFSTALMKIQLNISQFNSKPMICVVTGHSSPGLEE